MLFCATIFLFWGVRAAAGAEADCEPLNPDVCMFPFPSDFFRGADGKLAFTNATFPFDRRQRGIDATDWNNLDGFAPLMPLTTTLPGLALESGLLNAPRHWNMESSLRPDSPTILIHARTGARVAHWVELDHWSDRDGTDNAGDRALQIWPAKSLEWGERYIVAIRGLTTDTGIPITPSKAFRALRDGIPSAEPVIEGRREHFEAGVFSALAKAGVERSSLQLAWDFTVSSRAGVVAPLLAARDEAILLTGEAGPAFSVTQVVHNFSALISRKIDGTFEAPLFLESARPGLKARLRLDDNGLPTSAGFRANYSFEVLIPNTVVKGGAGVGAVLTYGHGLFGSKSEVENSYLQQLASEQRYILVATDWVGMASVDAVFVGLMMATDFSDFRIVPDRSIQGMVNALLMPRLVAGGLAAHPAMEAEGGGTLVSPDPARRFYFGNSQGGILGGVFMALSPDVRRGVLGVPGAPYSQLLPRSADFRELGAIIKARYASHADRVGLLSMMQLLWARAEPAGFADAISRAPLSGTPTHRVLLHYALGDAQVSWLGAHTLARSAGAKMFESNVRARLLIGNSNDTAVDEILYGFEMLSDEAVDSEGSVIVGFDFGAPNPPSVNVAPSTDFDTHELPRRDAAALQMLKRFFDHGEIVNTCGGACIRS